MSDFYDWVGNPITIDEWMVLFERDRTVAKNNLPDGMFVSTVWLGLDHQYGSGPPLIFETMAFDSEGEELCQQRYTSWQEAIDGHREVVETYLS